MSSNINGQHLITNGRQEENKTDKYLTFKLASEEYGLEILKVQEIIGLMAITTIPRTPEFVRGVINLRGNVIPVIDLRLKFGMESKDDAVETCIILVQIEKNGHHITMGIIVDYVSEVIAISSDKIEPPPDFGTNIDTDFIMGMGEIDKKVVILLEVDKVLSDKETDFIGNVSHEGNEATQSKKSKYDMGNDKAT